MSTRDERIYRRLLRLYPQEFRARFEAEMLDLFRARRNAVSTRQFGVFRFWVLVLDDLVRSAFAERFPGFVDPTVDSIPRSMVLGDIGYDIRQAWRVVTGAPLLTASITLLMALSIGSTTAVFAVVDAVLLRPFPFGQPKRLVMVWERRGAKIPRNTVGGHEFGEWKASARSFEHLAAMAFDRDFALTASGEPAALTGARVTSEFFPVMSVAPIVGRVFGPESDQPGSAPVVVISESLWRQRFGSDPAIAGRSIRLNDRPCTVVGVVPANFQFPPGPAGAAPDLWTPIAEPIHLYRGRHYLFVVGRLKEGVTIAQAQAEMEAIAARIAGDLPQFSKGHGANVLPLHGELVESVQRSLLLLFAGVALVLLIGCCNVASLLLARAAARQQEIAVRLALGAGWLRIARQLLTEGALLALLGGSAGTLLASWLLAIAVKAGAGEVSRLEAARIDPRVIAFAIGISALTAIVLGLVPIVQLARVQVADRLKNGSKGLARPSRQRLRRGLVVAEVALTVIVATGAALFLQSFYHLLHVQSGFTTDGVLAVEIALPGARYAAAPTQRIFFAEAVARTGTLRGVRSVSATNMVPQGSGRSGIAIGIEGRPKPPPGQEAYANYRVVTPDYFRTLNIPILRGRNFSAQDVRLAVPLIRWFPQQPLPPRFNEPQAAPTAVINESMARTYWPTEDPIGRRFTVLFSPAITVVGIVRDSRNQALSDAPVPEFYLSADQEPQTRMTLLVASTAHQAGSSESALAAPIRAQLASIDRDLPVGRVRTLADILDTNLALHRAITVLLAGFAAIALLLMTVGVYAVVSYTAAQRSYEIGVRVALGAQRHDIRRLIVFNGAGLAAAGIAVGLGGAFALARFAANLLYEVKPTDPSTYLALSALVLTIATVASWLPSRRAQRIDPVTVLPNE
jgi:putative ABC transport system permease protein